MKFLEILRLVRLVLAIGLPPDIREEVPFRRWCREVVRFLATLAELTATDVDDKFVAGLLAMVENDQHWSLLYSILLAASEYLRPDDQDGVIFVSGDVKQLANGVGISPGTLIAIVQLLLRLVELFGDRK